MSHVFGGYKGPYQLGTSALQDRRAGVGQRGYITIVHPDRDIPKGGTVYTWWLIPLSKWVITPIISGLTLLIPFITGVITHLLSGMSHQVQIIEHMEAS